MNKPKDRAVGRRTVLSASAAAAVLAAGAAGVARAQSAELRAQNFYPQGANSAWWVAGEKLFELMRDKTQGRVTVRHFPVGALVQIPDYVPAAQRGTIDMFTAFDSLVSGPFPWMEWNTVPGLVQWPEDFFALLDGGMFDHVDRLVQQRGLKLVSYWGHGDIMLVATRDRPIARLEDLRGLRIRAPGPLYARAFTAVGAAAVSIPPAEVFTALQTGVVDGVTLATYGYTSLRLNEVAPCMTFLGGQLVGSGTVGWFMGLDRWRRLPAADQAAITQAGREHMTWVTQYIKQINDEVLGSAGRLGIRATEVPEATLRGWTEVSRPAVLETYLQRSGAEGRAIIDRVEEFARSRRRG